MLVGKKTRLRLVEDNLDDAKRIVEWRNDPRIKAYFFETEPISLGSHIQWYKKNMNDPSQRYYMIDALSHWKTGDPLASPLSIGTMGLKNINWRSRNAEFGRFVIGEADFQGKGYGKESLVILLDYAFNHLNIHRIWLAITTVNRASKELYHTVGFLIDGILREHLYKNGQYVDIHILGLLKQEFLSKETTLRRELNL